MQAPDGDYCGLVLAVCAVNYGVMRGVACSSVLCCCKASMTLSCRLVHVVSFDERKKTRSEVQL